MKTTVNSFEAWMAKVDAILVRKCGLSSSDLCDICYMELHEDGYTPGEAARKAIRNEMGLDDE